MTKNNSRYKLLAIAVALMPIITHCADNNNKTITTIPVEPAGLGYEKTVAEPSVNYPLPVVDNFTAQIGKDHNGNAVNEYDRAVNPIIDILKGFDDIWSLGDSAWANGGANGGGPKGRFDNAHIVNAQVWKENMAYSLKVTGSTEGYERSYQDALNAYFDDLRTQNNSVISGLGPLADWYMKGSGASTLIDHKVGDQYLNSTDEKFFNVNQVIPYEEKDDDTFSSQSQLGKFVDFLKIIRGPEGTTSRAKYFYCSPRPWIMDDEGNVTQIGTKKLGEGEKREVGNQEMGERTLPVYASNIKVVPALIYSLENRGRQKDCGFPSGHTNAAYLAAFAFAYAMPERFAEMLTRAAQVGEDRIISGYHSPLDVIGGRVMATAMAAAYISHNPEAAEAALDNTRAYFESQIEDHETLAQYAQSHTDNDQFANDADNKAYYRARLTYTFKQDLGKAGQQMIVPKGAEVLLKSRLPYLSDEQRRAVLYTTGIDSGYPVLDASNGWGRLDLVTAADGYGAFVGDVYVDMDASKGHFNALDSWDNDISGKGKLVKSGTGKLMLTGNNSYSGGTVLNGGSLVAASATAFGSNDVYVNDGVIDVQTAEPLSISGNYTQRNGVLSLKLTKGNQSAVNVSKDVNIMAGRLVIDFAGNYEVKKGDTFTVLKADNINGKFDSVELVNGMNATVIYKSNKVLIKI